MSFVLLNCFMMLMQALGRDPLLNFGQGKNLLCFGITGGRMCMESMVIVSAAFLIQSRYKVAIWALVASAGLYLVIFKINAASQGGFLHNPLISRIPVWKETIELANHYPWTGWGIGSYKIFYHVFSKLGTYEWHEAHNDYLQILFETGWAGLLLMVVCVGSIFLRLKNRRLWKPLLGLSLILLDMGVHFPLREFQTFPVVVAFLAYCETLLVGSQVK
jgi:O-antigen ligase